MATTYRKRSLALGGQIENTDALAALGTGLTAAGTSLSSSALAALPLIGTDEYYVLDIDPDGEFGAPEVVYVTAHAATATTATLLRGQEGTSARDHPGGVYWVNSPTLKDFSFPLIQRAVGSNAGNYTTTSTTRTPIDATNLPFKYFELAVGDIVECVLFCSPFNTTTNYVCFDFEVDQPVSANTYIATGNDRGAGAHYGATGPNCEAIGGSFIATEAGVHGFRPVWFISGGGVGTIVNAASGDTDELVTFIVRHWPQ